jgi:acetyl/propionyl-CoA carboxylase alpha subunit
MKPVEFLIQGEMVSGYVEKVGTQIWISVNGKTFSLESDSKKSRKKASGAGSSPEITAPMPGKVTSMKFKNGDSVDIGDVVIVMEAMKMEYSLKAQIKGVLKSIKVKEQDQVVLGQVLAVVEETKT